MRRIYALFPNEEKLSTAIDAVEQKMSDAELRAIRRDDIVTGQGAVTDVPAANINMPAGMPAVVAPEALTAEALKGLSDDTVAFLRRQLDRGAVLLAVDTDQPTKAATMLEDMDAQVWR